MSTVGHVVELLSKRLGILCSVVYYIYMETGFSVDSNSNKNLLRDHLIFFLSMVFILAPMIFGIIIIQNQSYSLYRTNKLNRVESPCPCYRSGWNQESNSYDWYFRCPRFSFVISVCYSKWVIMHRKIASVTKIQITALGFMVSNRSKERILTHFWMCEPAFILRDGNFHSGAVFWSLKEKGYLF